MYTFGGGRMLPNRILPVALAKFTLRPSLAFSYIGSVTVRPLEQWASAKLAAWYKEWNYGTFTDGGTCGKAAITLGIGPHF